MKIGPPLRDSGILDQAELSRLRKLSITHVLEFVSCADADPAALAQFLGIDLVTLSEKRQRAFEHLPTDLQEAIDAANRHARQHGLGAQNPDSQPNIQ